MDILAAARTCFSADYAEARRRFLKAAKARKAAIRTYPNPNPGPKGEELAADCAWIGPRDAKNVLVMIAGTHGVEGFCGAGAIMDALTTPMRLPRGVAMLMIHAINPHGFAWIRRVTEEGVDLNRNFIEDFANPPANPGYDELADALLPAELSGPIFDKAQERQRDYIARHGLPAFNVAWSGGQYKYPRGMFYGGTGPTWSHRTQGAIVAEFEMKKRRRIVVIDYHTGLGPHGYGDLLCASMPETKSAALLRKVFDENLSEPFGGKTNAGQAAPGARHGFANLLWERALGGKVGYVGLEYGTYDSLGVVRPALVADHWLHARGPVRWNDAATRKIKAQLRKAFYPDTDSWREAVIWRSRQTLRLAAEGLAAA